jgi:hypothetical protein
MEDGFLITYMQSVPIITNVVSTNPAMDNNFAGKLLWQSVLLVGETGVPRENHLPATSNLQTLSHNVVHLALIEIRTRNVSCDRH